MKANTMMCLGSAIALALGGFGGTAMAGTGSPQVTRATLDNGLRVVIVPDKLAPVATMEMNYLVGSAEASADFPGTAHAMEHMMFRGGPGLSHDQLLAIGSSMGAVYNGLTFASNQQYVFTVPSQDIGVALHVAAIRMQGLNFNEKAWKKERGAIEQEVSRDNSSPVYKFQTHLHAKMFAGTPYAWMGAGTRPSFDKTTAKRLQKFYQSWYAPNNAILVIAGDVDPSSTLKQVKSLFGSIPSRKLPTRPEFKFQPVPASTQKLPSDFPVGIAVMAWRMPGLTSKDYATALVLSDALGSKRGKLHAMGLTGKALAGAFGSSFMPQAGIAYAQGIFRRGGDSEKVLGTVKQIMAHVRSHGVPEDLIEAAKSKAIAGLEYKKNSVRGLANSWSHALAFRHGKSPDDLKAAIEAVTPADVNAMAKRIFDPDHAMTAILTPKSSGKSVTSKSTFGKPETFGGTPSNNVTLPDWAQSAFAKLTLPRQVTHPKSFQLDNGLRVIVQPESVSKTIEVYGRVKTNSDLQAPKGKKGVAGVLAQMFKFGTQKMKRLEFQAALDKITADESAGTSFSLKVPTAHFEQGMKLLAANELHPAMPPQAFMFMQRRLAGIMGGKIQSPGFLDSIHQLKALLPKNDPEQRYATPKSIQSLSLDDVKNYYHKVFRPDMTTIVVVGDVTPRKARKVVKASFGDWKASGPKPNTDYPAVADNKPSHIHTPDSSAVQDSVTLTEMVKATRNSPDRYALELGNVVLSGGSGAGFHSMLMRDLRSKNGLVYSVNSDFSLDKHRGRFSVNYGSDPDKVGDARAMVIRDIKRLQSKPVSSTQLHDAKGRRLRFMQLTQSSFGSIAGTLLGLSLENKPLDTMHVAAHKFYDMNADQIQAAFKKYVRPDGFVTAVKGPKPKD